jgi:hypothetical protein
MPGLFATPQEIAAFEAQQRSQAFQRQDPIGGGLFNLGNELGNVFQRGIAGVDTRSKAQKKAGGIQKAIQGLDFSKPRTIVDAANRLNTEGNTEAAVQLLGLLPPPSKAPEIWSEPFEKVIEVVDPETGNTTRERMLLKKSSLGNVQSIGSVTSKPAPGTGQAGQTPKSFKPIGNIVVDGKQVAAFTHPGRHAGAPFIITGFDQKGQPITDATSSVGAELFTTERTIEPPQLSEKFDMATIMTELKTKFGGEFGIDFFGDMSKDEINSAALDISRMITTKKSLDNEFRQRFAANPTAAKREAVMEWLRLNRPDLVPETTEDERKTRLNRILGRRNVR